MKSLHADLPCFSLSPSNPLSPQRNFDIPLVEDPKPNGAGWLIHSKTLQMYLSLLETSHREETQEASCGVLHNLTASEGFVRRARAMLLSALEFRI